MKKLGIIALLLIVITTVGMLVLINSTHENLTENRWCVDSVVYNNVSYHPLSFGLSLGGSGFCKETIAFYKDETITLPGFNSYATNGSWKLQEEKLLISEVDSFGFLYNGLYDIELSTNRLLLKSPKTKIYGTVENVKFSLPRYKL